MRLARCVLILIVCLSTCSSAQNPFEDKTNLILDKVFDRLSDVSDNWFHRGEYLRVVQAHRMRIARDPTDLEAYFLAAWLLWSSGKSDEAQAMYSAAVQAAPESWEPYFEAGMHWSGRRDEHKAALWLISACTHGAPVRAWKMLSHTYRKLGEIQTALKVMEYAKIMDPTDDAIDRNLASLRELLRSPEDP